MSKSTHRRSSWASSFARLGSHASHATWRWSIAAWALTLVACASGPRIERIDPDTGDASNRVLYALPRALVAVSLPVTVTTFKATPLTDLIRKADTCKLKERLDINNECYWNFRTQDPGSAGALLVCKDDAIRQYLFAADDPDAVIVPVPDPDHLFAVNLVAEGLQRLKVDMTLSQTGAPSTLSFEASSPLPEALRLATDLAESSHLFHAPADFARIEMRDVDATSKTNLIQDVVTRLAELEKIKRQLMEKPGVTPASIELILHAQQAFRSLVEGKVVSESSVVRMLFDPARVDDRSKPISRILDAVGAESDGAFTLECADGVSSSGHWRLTLDAQEHSRQFAHANSPDAGQTNAEGFRYRIPVFATASLLFDACPSDDGDCDPMAMPIAGALPIPQWGPVRALPRRVGLGEGALSSTLDPVTGALVTVGSEGDNGAALDIAKDVASRLNKPPKPKPDELSVLERQVAICAARYQLGQPLDGECADFRPPE